MNVKEMKEINDITQYMTEEEVKAYNLGKLNTEYYFLTALREWYYHDYSDEKKYKRRGVKMARKILDDIADYFKGGDNNEENNQEM